jgi:hypothetical protein
LLKSPPADNEIMKTDRQVRKRRGGADSLKHDPRLLAAKEQFVASKSPSLGRRDMSASMMAALGGGADAFSVPVEITSYSAEGAILQGYLMKENPNGIAKIWKRRWFAQHEKKLLYYKDVKPGADRADGLKGFIPLQRASVSALPGYSRNRDFVFAIITPERTFHLQAADAADLHYWISSLHALFESPSLKGPDSEYTVGTDAGLLLPARDTGFANDAFAGELEVKVGPLQMWKKRYVVLSDGLLYSYKDVGKRKPERKVFLFESHLEEFEPSSAECVAFRVKASSGADIILRASSQEQMAAWSNAILRHRLAIEDQINSISTDI